MVVYRSRVVRLHPSCQPSPPWNLSPHSLLTGHAPVPMFLRGLAAGQVLVTVRPHLLLVCVTIDCNSSPGVVARLGATFRHVDAEQTGDRTATARRPRRWLAVAAVALVAASLLPPLEVLARRYLFVEAVQFCVFAMVAPALGVLGVLGAPQRLFPRGAARRPARPAEAGRRPGFAAAMGYLVTWAVIGLIWRLPPVLDALARHPVLVVPEALTLCAAGIGLWRELVHLPSRAPRLARPQRACVAALAMWSVWVVAYVLGFASHPVVGAYNHGGSHLLPVGDQEITAFVLWLAAAVCFLPVVFTAVLTWLKDSSEPAAEPRRDVSVPAVRGWERTARGRRRASAR